MPRPVLQPLPVLQLRCLHLHQPEELHCHHSNFLGKSELGTRAEMRVISQEMRVSPPERVGPLVSPPEMRITSLREVKVTETTTTEMTATEMKATEMTSKTEDDIVLNSEVLLLPDLLHPYLLQLCLLQLCLPQPEKTGTKDVQN